MSADWFFDDPPNIAVITTRQILELGYPILHVTHDAEDGGWQVLCGTTNDPSDARIIALGEAVQIDSSLMELANLPLGWKATRVSKDAPWIRKPK